MKKTVFSLLALCLLLLVSACNNHETYADQKKKERTAITNYVKTQNIKVLSEADFAAQGYTTDVNKNEYVQFDKNGVYMQIVNNGCGEVIKDGETVTVLCRFSETNIMTDSLQLTNNVMYYSSVMERMMVQNTKGTFTASFDPSSSLMYQIYSSTSVPTGWLVPLTYIKIGRPSAPGEQIAKVKLIVPHDSGQASATQRVYPCLYEITYERGL
jgi:hypothetical protein